MIRRLWTHRNLVLALTRVQYQIRFRQSSVGVLWAVIPPLATLGVAAIVFGNVAHVHTGQTSYAMFAMAALVPWTFFVNSLLFGVPSFLSVMPILVRFSFPRAAIPLSMVGASLIDLGVSALIFVIFAFTVGNGLPATTVWFPVLVAVELVFVTGIVLLGSALNVFARDVRLAVPVAAQLLLFVTPVMYPLSSVPRALRLFFLANPLTGLVESFRNVLVYGHSPDIGTLAPAIGGAAVAFVVGCWYFAATESRFADVV